MRGIVITIIFLIIAFGSTDVFAKKFDERIYKEGGKYHARQDVFNKWKKQLKKKAIKAGISRSLARKVIADIKFKSRIIELDKKQPEFTLTMKGYKKLIFTKRLQNNGKKFYKKHYKLLHRIGKKFGVHPRFIVALWGIETRYGHNTGSYHIPEALAVMAYEGRREKFFTSEFIHSLKIVQNGHVKLNNFKGSWAGAMGQIQFMPSSFNSYAVDFNKDGKKDIWHSYPDIFASIANYLSRHGWDKKYTWGRKVELQWSKRKSLKKVDPKKKYTLYEWNTMGVRRSNGWKLPKLRMSASLRVFNNDSSESYLTYHNYNVILKWNKSEYFGIVVGLLANSLKYQ